MNALNGEALHDVRVLIPSRIWQVLLARQGLHRDALVFLVHSKRDLDRAGAYCRTYAADDSQWQDHSNLLLTILFDHSKHALKHSNGGAEAEKRWAEACSSYAIYFIEKHAAMLSPQRVLMAIPVDLSLKCLEQYFRTLLPHQVDASRCHTFFPPYIIQQDLPYLVRSYHLQSNQVHDAQLRRGLARAQHLDTQQLLQVCFLICMLARGG